MKNELVVKSNSMINASYNLEVTEQRLILLAIIRARNYQQGITAESKLEIHASDYANEFSVSKDAAYKALKEGVNNLFERQFSFKEKHRDTGKIGIVRSRWVSRIKYVDELAILEITFAPDVVPLITRLESQFTSYQIKQITRLTSKYAIRLYEVLIAWRPTGKVPVLAIAEFRYILGIDDSEYPRVGDLKRRALDPAIAQINEFTDITVQYEQHKSGRNITGFSFTLKEKVNEKPSKVVKEKSKPTKKAAEPLKNTWNTPENSMFKMLYAKCPALTKTHIEDIAKTEGKSVNDLLNAMFMEYASVDSFEL